MLTKTKRSAEEGHKEEGLDTFGWTCSKCNFYERHFIPIILYLRAFITMTHTNTIELNFMLDINKCILNLSLGNLIGMGNNPFPNAQNNVLSFLDMVHLTLSIARHSVTWICLPKYKSWRWNPIELIFLLTFSIYCDPQYTFHYHYISPFDFLWPSLSHVPF